MTQRNSLSRQPIEIVAMAKPTLVGAAIALILISAFLISAGEPNPNWGKLWMIRPLIIVPLAGAAGGVIYYLMNRWSDKGGWRRLSTVFLGIIAYIFVLWIGTVLGLDGTYWD
jgi:hypothetical protein